MNIANNLLKVAYSLPDHVAVIDKGEKYSYGRLNEDSNAFASALIKMGIKKADNILICHKNSYEWLVGYFGTIKAGAVAVTVPSTLSKDEIGIIIDDCQPKAIVADEVNLQKMSELGINNIPLIAEGAEMGFYNILNSERVQFKLAHMDRSDPAAILYTGGTTGFPKGVILTHQNIQASYQNVAFNERTSWRDVSLCFLPLNHVFAQIHIVGSAIYSGATIVIHESFDMDKALEDIKRHKITKFYGVPTIYVRLLNLPDVQEKVKTLRYTFSAAASLAGDIAREWKNLTGLDIHEAYGMTESASMVTFNHYFRHVVGSVGTPANLVEVAILTKDGFTDDPGVEGEICIKGPNIMKGYLNRPKETSEAFIGDWFRSGDVGYLDEKGYLFLVDRIKDLIITGGENVYPKEVENVLYSEPEIQEAVVFGIPDREYGEKVVAMLVLKEGKSLDPAELRQRLKSRLAPYKVPKEFFIVDSIPRTSAGKVQKRQLKEIVLKGQIKS